MRDYECVEWCLIKINVIDGFEGDEHNKLKRETKEKLKHLIGDLRELSDRVGVDESQLNILAEFVSTLAKQGNASSTALSHTI